MSAMFCFLPPVFCPHNAFVQPYLALSAEYSPVVLTLLLTQELCTFHNLSSVLNSSASIKLVTEAVLEVHRKFPLAPMGVLAPVSADAGPSAQPPIGTSGNFPARVSAESISPNFPIFRSKYG